GIIGSGMVTRGVYEDRHWDDVRASTGGRAFFVELRYDVLLDPELDPILPRDRLNQGRLAAMHWDTQMSGIEVPADIAAALEATWVEWLASRYATSTDELIQVVTYRERALCQLSVNRYERSPIARQRCLDHHGVTCSVCGFDFEATYGEVAAGFIHVHHLR